MRHLPATHKQIPPSKLDKNESRHMNVRYLVNVLKEMTYSMSKNNPAQELIHEAAITKQKLPSPHLWQ